MNKNIKDLYQELDIKPKSNFVIDIIYNILNPIVSNYFNINPINTHVISKDKNSPILYLSRHYDEIDILCQQKISKEYRNKYPSYLVKKDLSFLNFFSFGVIPYYRGRDLKDSKNPKELLEYNKNITNNLIPKILSSREDFLIYPEGTRRKGKKFRVQNKALEEIITIYNISKNKFETIPKIISVDYKREDNNINMRFADPLIIEKEDLNLSQLKEYLYSTITY